MSLENKDQKILNILQRNSRLSVRTIAKELTIPPTTIHSRIKRMEREGVIKGYTLMVNESKLGVGAKAFVFISLSARSKKNDLEEIMGEITLYPEVQEVCTLSGDWDILVKIKTKTTDDIGKFLVKNLRNIKGIDKTVTSIVFDTFKETPNIIL
ncbi:MAG TPA: Lrp/AsnC family transcriptional regulator [archaeon]|nr:Lrp/AsnC family transcriptional regulator [archaeon]